MDSIPQGNLICIRCHKEKPLEAFSPRPDKKNGYHSTCRKCATERIHHLKAHPRYIQKPLLVISKKCSKCKIEKPLGQFYKNASQLDGLGNLCKPCQDKASFLRHRGLKYATQRDMVDYARILKRDGYQCYLCGMPIDPTVKKGPGKLNFDHVVPLARQGTHTEDNIKPTHAVCNARKGARLLEKMTAFHRRGLVG